jgi:hypothetical protein
MIQRVATILIVAGGNVVSRPTKGESLPVPPRRELRRGGCGESETTRSGSSSEGGPPEDRSGTGRQYQWSFLVVLCPRGDYYGIEISSGSRQTGRSK